MKMNKLMMTPLHPEDIYKISGKPFNLVLYSEIHDMNNVEQLFGGLKFAILLYEYKSRSGHYVLLSKYDDGKTIEYFDSIYQFPDIVLKKMNMNLRKSLNEDKAYLVNLLDKSRYDIEYVDFMLQGKKTSTCGRWCGLRMRYSDVSIDIFIEFFKSYNCSPDELCTIISNQISGI